MDDYEFCTELIKFNFVVIITEILFYLRRVN